jgi:hypothetical protein
MLALAIVDRQLIAAALVLLLATGTAIPVGWSMTHVAREIEATEEAITSRPFVGRRKTLLWSDIDSIERFAAFTLDTPRPDVYRIVSSERGDIAFTSRMGRFDELLAVVKKRVSMQEPVRQPTWWRLLLFRGFP